MEDELILGKKVQGGDSKYPEEKVFEGRYVRLERLDPEKHYRTLYENYKASPHVWDYIQETAPASLEEYRQRCHHKMLVKNRVCFAVSKKSAPQDYIGLLSLMSIMPQHRTIEIGAITFSEKLKKTTAATEAFYLMMKYCFQLGYLRLEWKCNNLNEPSKEAARRLGFRYEGVFLRHMIMKGYSRDSAWFSIIDEEWPAIRKELERWLEPSNFDESGQQLTKLNLRK